MSTKQNHNLPFDEDNGCFPPMSDEEFADKVEATNSPAAKQIEELERSNATLIDIIKRASTAFFGDGTDGETASRMLVILDEVNSLSNAQISRREADSTTKGTHE
jgi:hypothetical protein